MAGLSKNFNFDKSMILNAAYDSLDAMKFHIEEADSNLGHIRAITTCSGREKIVLSLFIEAALNNKNTVTTVQATTENESKKALDLINTLFDEIKRITEKCIKRT